MELGGQFHVPALLYSQAKNGPQNHSECWKTLTETDPRLSSHYIDLVYIAHQFTLISFVISMISKS